MNLLRVAASVSGMTLLSRITGFIREALIAIHFGAGASTDAFFASHFIRVGLSSCDVGTSYWLPRVVGPTMAAELMLTGRRVPAEEALRIGLVSRVVEPDALTDAALDLAAGITANSEFGVIFTKLGLWANFDAPSLRAAIELENRTQVLGTFTGNMAEAGEAFREKRDPHWKPM